MNFETLAKLNAAFADDPESLAHIAAEEERVKALLRLQEYSQLEVTKELAALCRRDIVTARMKLATDRSLSEEARQALWLLVDARSWFLEMVAKDYETELAAIDRDLSIELAA
jgi:hypothetical protein